MTTTRKSRKGIKTKPASRVKKNPQIKQMHAADSELSTCFGCGSDFNKTEMFFFTVKNTRTEKGYCKDCYERSIRKAAINGRLSGKREYAKTHMPTMIDLASPLARAEHHYHGPRHHSICEFGD